MGRLVAGVDCSTQATKVVVVDADDGSVQAEGAAPHTVTGDDGARESDPAVWEEALSEALAQTGRAGEIAAISVAGQQHGLVCLDADGRPLRPAVLWNDTRSGPDALGLRPALGGRAAWAERVGVVPVASFTVTSWAWLRRVEPDVTNATAAVRLPHDLVTQRLCGRGVTDRGDVSGTGWWSVADQAYATEVLELPEVVLDPALLPSVLGPSEVAGEVTSAAAERFGLRAGTVVGPGTGDNMGASLGVAAAPGRPVVSLGTSGAAFTTSEHRAVDPSGVVAGFADATGRYLPLSCTINCTQAVDRMAAWLSRDREAVEDGGEVVVLPFFGGERTPDLPDARGSVSGLTLGTTAGQVLRATYEGAAFSLLRGVEGLHAQRPSEPPDAPLLLLGGGARGSVWRTVLARLSGRALHVVSGVEVVARGAAMQAAAVLDGVDVTVVQQRWGPPSVTDEVPAEPRDDETRARLAAALEAVVA